MSTVEIEREFENKLTTNEFNQQDINNIYSGAESLDRVLWHLVNAGTLFV